MSIEQISYELAEVGIHSPQNYTNTYLKNETALLDWINSFDGLKSNIYVDYKNENIESWIRFSLLFSDFVSLIPSRGKTFSLTIPVAKPNDPRNSIQLLIPDNIMQEIFRFTPNPMFTPSYLNLSKSEIQNLCSSLNSNMKSGKVILRPERVIFEGIKPDKDTSIFSLFHVNPDSPVTKWDLIDSPESQKSIPITTNNQISGLEKELFEITLPYIENISFSDLELLIADELDLLSNFRVELKQTIQKSLETDNFHDIKNDILRPKLDKINRKFKSVQNFRLLKNAGVVIGSLVVSLIAIPTSGLLLVSNFLGLTLGSAGIIKNEIDYKKSLNELEDEPYYLLWKIKKMNKN